MDVDLEACIRGDKKAWDAFVERWSALIYGAVRRTLGRGGGGGSGGADVDDAVQEVFVRLVRAEYRLLRSYDPGRASLSTWLTVVARSVAIDHIRRRRPDAPGIDPARLPDRPQPVAAEPPPAPPVHILTPRQRLVLRMLFDEGMTVEEAAQVIGVNEQTIRSTKHKALTRLREEMGVGEKGGSGAGEHGSEERGT